MMANASPTPTPAQPAGTPAWAVWREAAGEPVRQELARLAPALEGFPVGPLLDLLLAADPHDRASAYCWVDRCLAHWIDALTAALQQPLGSRIESLARIEALQREARDALARLRVLLYQAEVVHPERGQLC